MTLNDIQHKRAIKKKQTNACYQHAPADKRADDILRSQQKQVKYVKHQPVNPSSAGLSVFRGRKV